MSAPPPHGHSANGVELTDDVIERLADKAEAGSDVEKLKPGVKRGRPPIGDGPAEVVQVRLDPQLRAAVTTRAEHDGVNTSEIVRQALRHHLHA